MAHPDTVNRYLSVKEVAAVLGISRRTIYRMVQNRDVRYHRLPNGRLRFRARDFLATEKPV